MEYPFYAAIAAIICMQNTVEESFKVGRNRVLGTILGAVIGVIFYSIRPTSILLSGVGIMIVIYICNLVKWNKSVTIAGIVFCVIMTNLDGRDPFFYALNRVLDTLLGIIVAVLVNYFIVPPNRLERILEESNEIIIRLMNLVKYKIVDNISINLNEIYSDIQNLEKNIDGYVYTFKLNKEEKIEIERINNIIEMSKEICLNLKTIEYIKEDYKLNEKNYHNIVKLYGGFDRNIKNSNNNINIVFNYHLDKIINNVKRINGIKNSNEMKKIESIS
jgi:uncharacterized membrane protein YgaE (UPF0421/DUF939 family)